MSGRRACLVALAAACACAAACRPAEHHPPSSSASAPAAVQPVALPDISRAADAVQAQIREQHAKMTSAVTPPAAPAAARAAAYGEMGKLFIATEFYAAAERCFLNARALAPGDMRWSYYLAHVARLANDPAKAAGLLRADAWPRSRTTCRRSSGLPRCTWRRASRRRAKPLLLKARTLAPREAAVMYGLGRVALEERDYAGATKELEAALALAPSATRVQYPLAMAYRGLGNTQAAEAHLRLRGEVDLPPADALMERRPRRC